MRARAHDLTVLAGLAASFALRRRERRMSRVLAQPIEPCTIPRCFRGARDIINILHGPLTGEYMGLVK